MSPPGIPDLALMESDGSGVLQPDVNPPVTGNGLTEQVIRMAAQGKGRYVHMIYQTLSPLLYGICLRYAPRREDAQDMLQESFIKIFSNLSRFRHEGSFEGWARRITVNTALEFLRKKSPYFEEIEKGRGVAGRDFIEESLQAGELMALLSQMPLGYRTVFNLYAIEGYSHGEIAAMLGISEGTSKSQLSRAKDWLRQKLIHIYPERFKNKLIENHEDDTD